MLSMVKNWLKLTKQSEVAIFRNIFSKTTMLPDFTLTHLCRDSVITGDATSTDFVVSACYSVSTG